MNLTDIKLDKEKIEHEITKMINEFQTKYNVSIQEVNLYQTCSRTLNKDKVCETKVNLKVIL